MLLLLTILITLMVLLCSSSLILYYLNMAWLCGVPVFWFCRTSRLWPHTPTETRVWRTRHFSSYFLLRGPCSILSLKKRKKKFCLFTWWTTAPHPPKRGNTVQTRDRSSIFATEVTVLFVQHGFEIFQTFQKTQSRVRYLPAHLQRYVFDFEIELKTNLILKWMSSFPAGKHICTVQNQETTPRKRPKALSFLPDTL